MLSGQGAHWADSNAELSFVLPSGFNDNNKARRVAQFGPGAGQGVGARVGGAGVGARVGATVGASEGTGVGAPKSGVVLSQRSPFSPEVQYLYVFCVLY